MNSIQAALVLYYRVYIHNTTCPGFRLSHCTWREFYWAMSVCTSRQNNLPNLDTSTANTSACVLGFIPVWDMMNHYIPNNIEPRSTWMGGSTLYNPSTCSIDYCTPEYISMSSEVCMFYGPRTNRKLLLYSGFVLSDNIYDAVQLDMRVLQSYYNQLTTSDQLCICSSSSSGSNSSSSNSSIVPMSVDSLRKVKDNLYQSIIKLLYSNNTNNNTNESVPDMYKVMLYNRNNNTNVMNSVYMFLLTCTMITCTGMYV